MKRHTLYFLVDDEDNVLEQYTDKRGLRHAAIFSNRRFAKVVASRRSKHYSIMSIKELFRRQESKSIKTFLKYVMSTPNIGITMPNRDDAVLITLTYDFLKNLGLEKELVELIEKTTE